MSDCREIPVCGVYVCMCVCEERMEERVMQISSLLTEVTLPPPPCHSSST